MLIAWLFVRDQLPKQYGICLKWLSNIVRSDHVLQWKCLQPLQNCYCIVICKDHHNILQSILKWLKIDELQNTVSSKVIHLLKLSPKALTSTPLLTNSYYNMLTWGLFCSIKLKYLYVYLDNLHESITIFHKPSI